MVTIGADWTEEGKSLKRARIFLHLERGGRDIASHDIFGIFNRLDNTQNYRLIKQENEIIKLSRPGDVYVLKAHLGLSKKDASS